MLTLTLLLALAAPPAGEPPIQWADGIRGQQIGPVHVTVTVFDKSTDRIEPSMSIRIETKNVSETKKADFSGWFDAGVVVLDEFENTYTPTRVWPLRPQSIRPGEMVPDLAEFELFVDKAKTIGVVIDGKAIGGEGRYYFAVRRDQFRVPPSLKKPAK